jgi:2,4-dienoyl-CoA reductase-like NADH-dependent reductase (Old Yellow Enzyme family)
MIVVEPVPVHRTAVLTRGNFRHSTDEVIPHFRKITDAVHGHGAVICNQLYHVGQHGDFDNSYEPSWSPSGLPSFHDSDGSHAMSEAEIERTIAAYGQAAARAARIGFDMVELHAAHGYLIHQFHSPISNKRTDGWGGDGHKRLRFALAAAEACRAHRLATADAIIFATARLRGATLLTCDAHFEGLPGVTLIGKAST